MRGFLFIILGFVVFVGGATCFGVYWERWRVTRKCTDFCHTRQWQFRGLKVCKNHYTMLVTDADGLKTCRFRLIKGQIELI